MINKLNHKSISVYRVIKLSKNPAQIKIGINPTTIFILSFAPFLKDSSRVKVLGNMKLFPNIKPAQPAITIADISKVPCIQTTFKAFPNTLYW